MFSGAFCSALLSLFIPISGRQPRLLPANRCHIFDYKLFSGKQSPILPFKIKIMKHEQ
jgi:hypothetical protein